MNQYGLLNHIFGTKPLPKTMRNFIQLVPQIQTEVSIKSIENFKYENWIWKFHTFAQAMVQGYGF